MSIFQRSACTRIALATCTWFVLTGAILFVISWEDLFMVSTEKITSQALGTDVILTATSNASWSALPGAIDSYHPADSASASAIQSNVAAESGADHPGAPSPGPDMASKETSLDVGSGNSTPVPTPGRSASLEKQTTATGALLRLKARATQKRKKAQAKRPLNKIKLIDGAESRSCGVPREPSRCQLSPGARIHLLVISATWYKENQTEGETWSLIKSILFQTRCKLWVHFVVSGEPEVTAIPLMMEEAGAWMVLPIGPFSRSPQAPEQALEGYVNTTIPDDAALLYSLHHIPEEWVNDRLKVLNMYPAQHHAGLAGISKFFFSDIFWQVEQAIYLDIDTMVGGDIQDLWHYLRAMEEDQELLFFMGDDNRGPGTGPNHRPYCSGVMVLDLGRMRRANLTELVVRSLEGQDATSLPGYIPGDQWLHTRVCKTFNGTCRMLPIMWNVSGCSKGLPYLGLSSRGKEANGSCWRIVHFNCFNKKSLSAAPRGWKNAVRWANSLKLSNLRQMKDGRTWKTT